ncbi:MAG: STAS domain-containing protein [Bacteroidia bacterium]|nr:STAS domain-containing protein [Bacteroidia bacterium]
MEFKESKSGEFWVIELIGPLDTPKHMELQRKLLGIIENGERKVVVNCAGLTYISSSGLRILLVTLKKITAAGGELRLAGLRDNIREILVIAGFTSIFSIYNTLDEAVQ